MGEEDAIDDIAQQPGQREPEPGRQEGQADRAEEQRPRRRVSPPESSLDRHGPGPLTT